MAAVAELAVSNICWGDGRDVQEVAIDTLHKAGVHAIDIAPGKAFPEFAHGGIEAIDVDELLAFRRTLRVRSGSYEGPVRVAGLQAVTYGRNESIFSDQHEDVDALSRHMEGVIRLAELVGAQTIVYGSAGTRITEGRDAHEVYDKALNFFVPLAMRAQEAGITLGVEPVSQTWTKGRQVFGNSAEEIVQFGRGAQAEFGYSPKLAPDSAAMHDAHDDMQRAVHDAAHFGLLAPHAQAAESAMEPATVDSPISESHGRLDLALADNFAHLAEERRAVGAPLPTLAIEMFAPKDKDGFPASLDDVRFTLGAAIHAVQYHYSRTLNDGKAR